MYIHVVNKNIEADLCPFRVCATPTYPGMRRVGVFAKVVGSYVVQLDRRALLIFSAGLK